MNLKKEEEKKRKKNTIDFPMSTTSHDIRCEHCSLTFANRSLYEQHIQTCPKASVICPFNKLGCQIQVHLILSIIKLSITSN